MAEEWGAIPWAQVALVLGPRSGLTMLDIDAEEPALVAAVLNALPASPWHRPGSRGTVVAYRRGNGAPVRGRLVDRRPVFDVLGDGQRLVVPPSVNTSTGLPYTATSDLAEVAGDLPVLPEDYAERIVQEAGKQGFPVVLHGVK